MSILIVEDNAGDITLLRTALKARRLDGEMTIIRDGESALAFADTIDAGPEATCPRLVLLDLNLPKVNGREILKRFRTSVRLSAVPIVVLSSSSDERDKASALTLGATRYLQKPLDLTAFMDIGAIVEGLLLESKE